MSSPRFLPPNAQKKIDPEAAAKADLQ